MGDLIKMEAHHKIFKKSILVLLLSGAMNTYADKSTKKRLYTICRTYGFAP
jgi:hypothetical protein